VHLVGEKLQTKFNWLNKAKYTGANLLQRFAGTQAQGIKLPDARNSNWKLDLVTHIKNVQLKTDQRLVFLWDEIPLMLYNIKKASDMSVARDVLDILRMLRQEHGVRMILTGSIGLHHVISDLQSQGNANAPINDLRQIEVIPLSPEFGKELSLKLLTGEGIESDDQEKMAQEIAENADRIPYYIHHLVIELKKTSRKTDPAVLQEAIQSCLARASDPWNLRYYRERIKTYYADERAGIAIAMLDHLCAQQTPQTVDEIFNAVKSKMSLAESKRETVREIARILELDHYLTGSESGKLGFRSSLVKRWWGQQQ
jgi:hypothetical protein